MDWLLQRFVKNWCDQLSVFEPVQFCQNGTTPPCKLVLKAQNKMWKNIFFYNDSKDFSQKKKSILKLWE